MPGHLRRVAVLGWWPALLVAVVAGAVLHSTTHVALRDVMAYAAWFLWACTLPGTLLWRLVDWRRPGGRVGRPLLEDLVLGSILGIAAIVPVHLAMTWLGVPLLVLAWPLPVVGALAATRRGRDLLLSRQATPTPLWWSWGLGLLVLFVVVWTARFNFYGVLTLSPESLVAPYVDEPYHQSLVAEFAQHFPAQIPYVDGTPLRYHWLVYPFLAAGVLGQRRRDGAAAAGAGAVRAERADAARRGRGRRADERPPLGGPRRRGRALPALPTRRDGLDRLQRTVGRARPGRPSSPPPRPTPARSALSSW